MTYHIYDQTIEIDDKLAGFYETIHGNDLKDGNILYFAEIADCTPDMLTEELQKRIEHEIWEELCDISQLPEVIAEAEQRGVIHA